MTKRANTSLVEQAKNAPELNDSVSNLPWDDRQALWAYAVAEGKKRRAADDLVPVVERCVLLAEAEDGAEAETLVLPLRWLAKLYGEQQKPQQRLAALGRACTLLEKHKGMNHAKTVECLVDFLTQCQALDADLVVSGQNDNPQRLRWQVFQQLARRKEALDEMPAALLETFALALWDPMGGNSVYNRAAFTLLHNYAKRSLAAAALPVPVIMDFDACCRIELLWHIAGELGRSEQIAPILREVITLMESCKAIDKADKDQLKRMRGWLRGLRQPLPEKQMKMIQPLLDAMMR